MTAIAQRSFAGGEIAPALYARVDQVKYATGLKRCRNFYVMRYGGTTNRPGTEYVAECLVRGKTVRLIPFVFNAAQTYQLEFGHLYMRVIKNGAQVFTAASPYTITGISTASGAYVVTIVAHGLSAGMEVHLKNVGGMPELNNRNFLVDSPTANTFRLVEIDSTSISIAGAGTYTSGGTASHVYKITTPYTEADLTTLQWAQSADVLTITTRNAQPYELARLSDASWTLTAITFAPGIAAPTGLTCSAPAGGATSWVVTSVASETLEESLQSSAVTASTLPTSGTPHTVSWSAATGAQEYNVYRIKNGVYGFVGVAQGTSFQDVGVDPDIQNTPPIARNPFASPGDYPSTVAYYQQRLAFANTTNNPETVWTSRVGLFKNFTVSAPGQDDDAITFTLAGRQVNAVKHLVELGKLLALTSGGEWAVRGDAAGILKPTDINPAQYSNNGSGDISPLIVGGQAIYLQARGNVVRDLNFDQTIDGYRGNDLTVFSAHLVDGFEITDWTYQQVPHSIVWMVRDDGVLLGMTYMREHELVGWHRHDFYGGTVENACAIPEGPEDALYVVVKRTVGGVARRYIERMASRNFDDIVDAVFMDSFLTYDGRNTGATTMTLSGGTTWAADETLTLTASAASFTAGDVGNAIHLETADGDVIRFLINAYTSTTVITGKPNKLVPAALRSAATTNWAKAVDSISGLAHLEGFAVSVFADGFVIANPNDPESDTYTVTHGQITLPRPYAVIHAGLPITADLETLDIDTAQGQTMVDKKKLINRVTVYTEKSRGIWIAPHTPDDDALDRDLFAEAKIRNAENYDDPVTPLTGTVDVNIKAEWTSNGRIFIRQTDPLPLSVLAVVPTGFIPIMG